MSAPAGGCNVSPECYGHLTHMLKTLAPSVLLLEGGYNLDATARAVEVCLRVLQGESPPKLPGDWQTSSTGWMAIMNAMQVSALRCCRGGCAAAFMVSSWEEGRGLGECRSCLK